MIWPILHGLERITLSTEDSPERLNSEAAFQDQRMRQALEGKTEFRDRFYFVNRVALEKYEDFHKHLQGRQVVVVGCSDGMVTILARQGVHVEGTDISAVSLEKLQRSIAKEKLGGFASTRLMNAEDLEYPDASIDVITCSGVLHHVDTEKALRSWARCLKNNGSVFMFEPLAFHPVAAFFRILTPRMRTPDEHPLRPVDFDLMDRYFGSVDRSDYGLTTPLCAAVAVMPGLQGIARWLLPVLEATDSVLLRALPFLRTICWLTVVKLQQPRPAQR